MNLTPNFTLEEMTFSQTAARLGIVNTPSTEIIQNLKRTAGVLEQIREKGGGVPIIVSSGYRSMNLNRAIGGARSSAHVSGLAADIGRLKTAPIDLARMIEQSGIEFDQLILEFGRWVHVGLAPDGVKPRGEVLTARHDIVKTIYLKGIIA